MAIISPKNLNKWQPNTPILSSEAREEFLNIYNLVNGNIDSANIKNGSITGGKLADGSITGAKISSIPASKIDGRLETSNLPENILTTSGGSLTGTLTFDVAPSTPLLKNYDTEETVLYEGGTGTSKIKIVVGGTDVMKILVNDEVLWKVTTDGTEVPKQFKIPSG